MKTRRLKIIGASTAATANAVATLTFTRNGTITGVSWINAFTALANSAIARIELSFQSTGQPAVNETTNVISEYAIGVTISGGAGGMVPTPFVDLGLAIPVLAGDKVYLNVYISGAAATVVPGAILSVAE